MRKRRILEWIVVVVIIAILVMVLTPMLSEDRDEARKVRCASNLKCIGTSMNMYLTGIGNSAWYSQPARVFYGDTWLLSLYWESIVHAPMIFICPATTDDWRKICALMPKKYDACIDGDAVSYAGRCSGLLSRTWRNTSDFSEGGMLGGSAMACDDNQGKPHHPDGINVVFFDSHVEFINNQPGVSAYSQVGAKGTTWCNGELEKMDSGGGDYGTKNMIYSQIGKKVRVTEWGGASSN